MALRLLRTPALALTSVSLIALLGTSAVAQTAPAASATTADTDQAPGPEVVITGTRIRNADFETANPAS